MKAKEYFELWSPAANHAPAAAIQMQLLDAFGKELRDVARQRNYKGPAKHRLAKEFSDKWDAVAALFEKSGRTVLEPGAFSRYYLEKHPGARSELRQPGVRLPSLAQRTEVRYRPLHDGKPVSALDCGHPVMDLHNPNALVTLMMLGRAMGGRA